MEYRLPDMREEGAYIRTLHPDAIARAKDKIKSKLEAVLKTMDDALAHQEEHMCSICSELDYGYKDIPNDWAYIAGTNRLLCNNCLGRWYERFELPELNKEIEL